MAYAQDIHLEDIGTWRIIKDYWESGNYEAAINYLDAHQDELSSKSLQAELFNNLTDWIVELEQNEDPTFKQTKIEVSPTPPSGMIAGQIYFRTI